MVRRKWFWLACAFVAGLFLVGLPHWAQPANRVDFLDPAMISALAGVAAIAMMLVVGEVAVPRRAWLVMALCLPVAVLARIVAETSQDVAAHQLWPFELIFAFLMGAVSVLPGTLAGAWSQRLQNRGRS